MDLTVVAIPAYFGTMGVEYVYQKRKAERQGPTAGTYERNDTIASLTMGVGSLLAPLVAAKAMAPITPGKGRYGKALVAGALGAVAVTTVADRLGRLDAGPPARAATDPVAGELLGEDDTGDSTTRGTVEPSGNRGRRRRIAAMARKVARVGGVAAVAAGTVAVATAAADRFSASRLFEHRLLPDMGNGPAAIVAATFGWDFIYYWNHRFGHESRFLWAIHEVHHSSEHYNLSTALRQPVLDAFGLFVPYGLLSLVGFRPSVIMQARALNLIYQYWIHTEAIDRLGPAEEVLNTPSHHRAHHGSNPQYLDRNHGSILITWDKLFGTFEPEDEPVVYGLTTNIDTFNPLRVATHEHADMLRDVADSTTWSDRLGFVVRPPGWAMARRAELDAAAHEVPDREALATSA